MTELSRRTILKASVAAGVAAPIGMGMTTKGQAAAPAADKQAPSYYRYKVGDIGVTVISDGGRTFPLPDGFVANAKKDEINKALDAAFMPKDQMTIVFNPLVLNTGGKVVVIDTGNGEGAYAQTKGAAGQFHTNLTAAGFDRNAVDIVVISHFHGDHVNGLLTADGKPSFPNAEIKVPEVEWKYWMDDGEMSRAPAGRMADLFKANRKIFDALGRKVTPYAWDKDVAPGITAVESTGHTPGHTSFVVSSGNGKVFVQSDVTNHPALFVRNPQWHASFDQDGAQAEKTRRRIYDMVAAEKLPMQGFHYPFPSFGHVEKDGTGYRFVPAMWNATL